MRQWDNGSPRAFQALRCGFDFRLSLQPHRCARCARALGKREVTVRSRDEAPSLLGVTAACRVLTPRGERSNRSGGTIRGPSVIAAREVVALQDPGRNRRITPIGTWCNGSTLALGARWCGFESRGPNHLRDRLTVGSPALNRRIGVRIPVSQPTSGSANGKLHGC